MKILFIALMMIELLLPASSWAMPTVGDSITANISETDIDGNVKTAVLTIEIMAFDAASKRFQIRQDITPDTGSPKDDLDWYDAGDMSAVPTDAWIRDVLKNCYVRGGTPGMTVVGSILVETCKTVNGAGDTVWNGLVPFGTLKFDYMATYTHVVLTVTSYHFGKP